MINETVLRIEAIDLLIKTFGVLDTERFITSIKSSNFDYTEWHKNLWKDKNIEEIHKMATEFATKKI
ncbi:MAG: hypothetical protein LBC67_00485 [Spirochaetales bacterium]|jgi:hypothetical protein|nr:hypothetical protein [Spirochaetales bacterium]